MRHSLKMFVQVENLKGYAKTLEAEERPEMRRMLLRLLAEERANVPATISSATAPGFPR